MRPATRRLRGPAAIAGCVAGLFVLLRISGAIDGMASVFLALGICLSVPTSGLLARRVLIGACIAFGWIPAMWWLPLPLGRIGRATLLLAGIIAGVSFWVASGNSPVERLKRLRPEVSGVDLVWITAGGIGFWLLKPWLSVQSGQAALSLMLPSGDNAAHFNFFWMIRTHGATVDALGHAADGTPYYGNAYPQSFHANAAFIDELLNGAITRSSSQELVGFVHATALIFISIPVLIVAGLCSSPMLRTRPSLLIPASALVVAAFLFGPGADSLEFGFTEFVLASGMVVAVGLLIVELKYTVRPVELAAIAGAEVCAAYSWAPMAILGLLAAAAGLLPLKKSRWSCRRTQAVASIALSLATGIAFIRLAQILGRVAHSSTPGSATIHSATGVFTTDLGGSIVRPSVPTAVLFTISAALVCLLGCGAIYRQTRSLDGRSQRTVGVVAIPAFGLALALTLAVVQWRSLGSVGYYFWKFVTGVELVSAATMAVATMTTYEISAPRPGRWAAITVSALSTAIALQVFGLSIPSNGPADEYRSAGLGFRFEATTLLRSSSPAAADVIAAATVITQKDLRQAVFLPTRRDKVGSVVAQKWLLALTRTWTIHSDQSAETNRAVIDPAYLSQAADEIIALVRSDPSQNVIVASDILESIRDRLPASVAARVWALPKS